MIAQRLKALRKELHMTQTEFGEAIGLSQGHLTSIESGKRNVTDRTIATICRVFKVNEQWLREGTDAMFVGARGGILDELAEVYHLDPLELMAVEVFLALPSKERQGALAFVSSMADRINCECEPARHNHKPSDPDAHAALDGQGIEEGYSQDVP